MEGLEASFVFSRMDNELKVRKKSTVIKPNKRQIGRFFALLLKESEYSHLIFTAIAVIDFSQILKEV